VLADGNDQIWLGTLDGGLSYFNGSKFSRIKKRYELASNIVYSLAQDTDRDLWVGTNRGVERLRDGRVFQTLTKRQGLPSDTVRSLHRDRAGTIWAGTDAGPAKLVGERFVQPFALRKALRAPITAIGEDLAGRIFFSTEQGGVYSFARGKVDEILYHGAPILYADSFYTDADGCVWIGTIGNGLLLVDHGKVFEYAMRDGLYDNEIFGIVGDSQERLWFTCIKGLYSVNRADLRRFAAGEIKHFTSTTYNSMDSLSAIEGKSGSQPAISRTHDGRIWFSANRGLVAFDPNRHPRESSVPPVAIEQVIVNGQISDAKTLEKLPPGEKNLEFRYTGIDLTRPAGMNFRYKLEGYDKEWIDAGSRREAYYTKLPPGQFRFRVTACTAEGICNTDGARVDFGLAYWYYQQSWFLPGCVSLATLAIWFLYKLRVRQLRERFSLVLAERTRIARELHDTLIHGLSGLTMQVQALAHRTRFAEDKDALEEIISDAAACMQETRQSVVGLRSTQQSTSGLAAAIGAAAQQITKETDIRLKLELDTKTRSLPADVEYNLLYIAREAVSNSVRHSRAHTIEVVLTWAEEQLQLIIKDDGQGFDRQHAGDRPVGQFGLIGMKERAALIGADFDLESRLGHGTAIFVSLPGVKSEWELSDHVKEESTR
jgi:two-component sensor histidine kinase